MGKSRRDEAVVYLPQTSSSAAHKSLRHEKVLVKCSGCGRPQPPTRLAVVAANLLQAVFVCLEARFHPQQGVALPALDSGDTHRNRRLGSTFCHLQRFARNWKGVRRDRTF